MVNSPQQIKNKIRKRVMKMVINDSNILNKWAMLSSLLYDKRLHDVDVVKTDVNGMFRLDGGEVIDWGDESVHVIHVIYLRMYFL